MIGAAVLATGAALWFLTRDGETIKFDPTKHTVEELRKIVHELFVEGATLYCQKLNMIKNLKNTEGLQDEVFENMKFKQRNELQQAEALIYEENGIDEDFMNEWMKKFANDTEISNTLQKLQQLEKEVFDKENPRIEHLVCPNLPERTGEDGNPEQLNGDTYIVIWRK